MIRTKRYKQEFRRIMANAKQSDKFKETARQIGVDESEEEFDKKLKRIAQKPKQTVPDK